MSNLTAQPTQLFDTVASFMDGIGTIRKAYLYGNNFWHQPDSDVNLHVDFSFNGKEYQLKEELGSTNGGASFANVTIKDKTTNEVVYHDYFHDGNGAWQTNDGNDAACYYTSLTNQVLRLFRKYVK